MENEKNFPREFYGYVGNHLNFDSDDFRKKIWENKFSATLSPPGRTVRFFEKNQNLADRGYTGRRPMTISLANLANFGLHPKFQRDEKNRRNFFHTVGNGLPFRSGDYGKTKKFIYFSFARAPGWGRKISPKFGHLQNWNEINSSGENLADISESIWNSIPPIISERLSAEKFLHRSHRIGGVKSHWKILTKSRRIQKWNGIKDTGQNLHVCRNRSIFSSR